jgi:hypothetical protein
MCSQAVLRSCRRIVYTSIVSCLTIPHKTGRPAFNETVNHVATHRVTAWERKYFIEGYRHNSEIVTFLRESFKIS